MLTTDSTGALKERDSVIPAFVKPLSDYAILSSSSNCSGDNEISLFCSSKEGESFYSSCTLSNRDCLILKKLIQRDTKLKIYPAVLLLI